jgi:hypothetical protein
MIPNVTLVAAIKATFLAALLVFSNGIRADAHEEGTDVRAMAITVEAVVTNVDAENQRVTLEGARGHQFTVTVPEEAGNIQDLNVGDRLVATYIAALEGELREPTEEELAEPWMVIEDAGMSEEDGTTSVGGARLIRAVCTIEGLNRILGTATIKDSRGDLHVIRDIEPEKMAGVTLGQTVVVVYTEALAMSLVPVSSGE